MLDYFIVLFLFILLAACAKFSRSSDVYTFSLSYL